MIFTTRQQAGISRFWPTLHGHCWFVGFATMLCAFATNPTLGQIASIEILRRDELPYSWNWFRNNDISQRFVGAYRITMPYQPELILLTMPVPDTGWSFIFGEETSTLGEKTKRITFTRGLVSAVSIGGDRSLFLSVRTSSNLNETPAIQPSTTLWVAEDLPNGTRAVPLDDILYQAAEAAYCQKEVPANNEEARFVAVFRELFGPSAQTTDCSIENMKKVMTALLERRYAGLSGDGNLQARARQKIADIIYLAQRTPTFKLTSSFQRLGKSEAIVARTELKRRYEELSVLGKAVCRASGRATVEVDDLREGLSELLWGECRVGELLVTNDGRPMTLLRRTDAGFVTVQHFAEPKAEPVATFRPEPEQLAEDLTGQAFLAPGEAVAEAAQVLAVQADWPYQCAEYQATDDSCGTIARRGSDSQEGGVANIYNLDGHQVLRSEFEYKIFHNFFCIRLSSGRHMIEPDMSTPSEMVMERINGQAEAVPGHVCSAIITAANNKNYIVTKFYRVDTGELITRRSDIRFLRQPRALRQSTGQL